MIRKKNLFRTGIWSVLFVIVIGVIISVYRLTNQFLLFKASEENSMIFSLIEAVALLVSLIIAISQLRDSKEIARGTFITDLNKAYVENPEYIEIYNHLQRCYDGECPNKINCKNDTECILDIKKGEVSNYLTFFETIYILYKNRVISFEIINDLFAYRFFLAVHSKYMQQTKLKAQPWNFKNIYCLEYEWLEYRKKAAKKRNIKTEPNDIYSQRLLKDLVSIQEYNDLIKDVI